jgi:Ras-related C3 botulinum toxin substrate 1
VFLLCFSIVNPVSYQNITAKWYKEVIHYCPDVPLILVGTKLDLREDAATISKLQALGQAPVSTAKGQELASKINAFKYMECSAMTQLGLKARAVLCFLVCFLLPSFCRMCLTRRSRACCSPTRAPRRAPAAVRSCDQCSE